MASAIDFLPTISSCKSVSQMNLATARWRPHAGYVCSENGSRSVEQRKSAAPRPGHGRRRIKTGPQGPVQIHQRCAKTLLDLGLAEFNVLARDRVGLLLLHLVGHGAAIIPSAVL